MQHMVFFSSTIVFKSALDKLNMALYQRSIIARLYSYHGNTTTSLKRKVRRTSK
jgi:hypothetical protein